MSTVRIQHYLNRAERFTEGMKHLRSEENFLASALLGIHAAIAYLDALRIGLGDLSLASDDHQSSVKSLERLLAARSYKGDRSGISRMKSLLSQKSRVAYGEERLSAKHFESIFIDEDRYSLWANRVAVELKLEGWRHGDER